MTGCFEFPYEDLIRKPQLGEEWEKFKFFDNALMGYFFKNLAILLFDEAGYEVHPFGYESLLPALKRRLYPSSSSSEVEQRIRATPDLIVRNPKDGTLSLVEVKYRTGHVEEVAPGFPFTFIDLKELNLYKRFWPESVLLVFTHSPNYVYAQEVGKLAEAAEVEYASYGIGTEDGRSIAVEMMFEPAEKTFSLLSNLNEGFRRKVARKVATMLSLRLEGRI